MVLHLALLMVQGHVSGQTVADSAKALLKAFDVPGPYRLQSVGPNYRDRDNLGFSGTLTDKLGRTISFYTDKAGRITSMMAPLTDRGRSQPVKDVSPAILNRFQRWLKLIPSSVDLGPAEMTYSTLVDSVNYRLLARGYPFVGPGTYYGITLSAKPNGGAFVSYSASLSAPAVPNSVAKLSSGDALQALARIYRDELGPEGAARGWKLSYDLLNPPKLGWVVPVEKAVPVLAWVIDIHAVRSGDFAVQGGSATMAVDAVTGKRVRGQFLQ